MSQPFLPLLEVGKTYRARDFQALSFSSQKSHRGLTGEDAAILRLTLKNSTIIEIPISDEDLEHHLRLLIEAYPSEAIRYMRQKWPKLFAET